MASLYKKMINGKPYWYLREMGWADGKPKLVSERYLGARAHPPPGVRGCGRGLGDAP